AAEPVVYSDETADAVREQLIGLDGVLVWVNPVENGHDRSKLDPLLRAVADDGVWVSAHPDVILRMATKQVIVDTAEMSWSPEVHLYDSHEQLARELPGRVAELGPLVLKQHRGQGGSGVWKVKVVSDRPSIVCVQHAAGEGTLEELAMNEFVDRCASSFLGGGLMVEQPFQHRLAEGMIRVYLSHDRVVGFAHQYPRGLLPPGPPPPAGKTFDLPSEPRYRALRRRMESEWVPELQQILELETHALPAIWDADFLYGPKTAAGEDTYVLCEINASSTFAFP